MKTSNISATVGMMNYNENSKTQLAALNSMTSLIHLGLAHLNITPTVIADFGASHGKNSIEAIKIMIEYLKKTNKLLPSLLIIHNDLPTNDWTTLFQLLAQDNSYYSMANGHSFYEQCLPSNSLSIGFSSYAINWLSKIPNNISNQRFYMLANEQDHQAFKDQAKLDFNAFIQHRSKELQTGGILLLSIPSVDDDGFDSLSYGIDNLYTSARTYFTSKEFQEFTPPVYYRPLLECIDYSLFEQCSLELIKVESIQVKFPVVEQYRNGQLTLDQVALGITKVVQTLFELNVRQVLKANGRSNEEIEKVSIEFWLLYQQNIKENINLYLENTPFVCANLILKKKEN